MKIFSKIKIIDTSRVFSGPFATRHFSDFGAEVIKVEPPDGDDSRHFPPIVNGFSGYYELVNRGKQSMFLDLKQKKDRVIFYRMCKDADVFVENYSRGVTTKLCIDYKTIKEINPRIIYASITGVSSDVDKKYYDVIAQAESGLISLIGKTEDIKIPTSVVDAFTGMKLSFAIASALYYRSKTDKGLQIHVSMKGCAFDLLEQNLIQASIEKKNPKKIGNMDSAIAPFGIFSTKDGSIALACGNERLWEKLRKFLRIEESYSSLYFQTNQDRIHNIHLLIETIETVFKTYNTASLSSHLDDLGIPNGKVMKMLDVLQDDENYSRKLLRKLHHPQLGDIVEPVGGVFYDE